MRSLKTKAKTGSDREKVLGVDRNKCKLTPSNCKKGPVPQLMKNDHAHVDFSRPSFSLKKKEAARLEASLATGDNTLMDADLSTRDLAAPHRAPYSKLKDLVLNGNKAEVNTLCMNLTKASSHCETAFRKINNPYLKEKFIRLANLYESTRKNVETALVYYNNSTLSPNSSAKRQLITALNNLASNAPGLGPQSTTNAIVSDRRHLHPTDKLDEPMTPRSNAASFSFPSIPIATTSTQGLSHQVVSVTGARHSLALGSNNFEDVNVGSAVVRGALFVDSDYMVYRPKNPYSEPTHNFAHDWERIS